MFGKLQGTKQEIQDLQEEHSKERQELEQTQEELTRDLKLKYGYSMSRKDIIFKRAFFLICVFKTIYIYFSEINFAKYIKGKKSNLIMSNITILEPTLFFIFFFFTV